jgi:hypothetical protein
MTADDAHKLETVTLTLRRSDIAGAARHGRVFELMAVVGLMRAAVLIVSCGDSVHLPPGLRDGMMASR